MVENVRFDSGIVFVTVILLNTGSTIWPVATNSRGWVMIALVEASGSGREARNRLPLPHAVLPGQDARVDCRFEVPNIVPPFGVTLVSEFSFWFKELVDWH